MRIIKELTSGVWCPQSTQQLVGTKRGALGRFPTSVSPAAPLFCPVDDKGHPPVPPRISPTPAVGGRRAGVMSLRCQHKTRLKSKALAPFSLSAMGCACPSEVPGFAAYRSLHHPPVPQIHPSPTHEEGLQFFIFYLNDLFFSFPISHYIDFSPSLAPFNPVLEVQTLNIYSLNVAKCSQ